MLVKMMKNYVVCFLDFFMNVVEDDEEVEGRR